MSAKYEIDIDSKKNTFVKKIENLFFSLSAKLTSIKVRHTTPGQIMTRYMYRLEAWYTDIPIVLDLAVHLDGWSSQDYTNYDQDFTMGWGVGWEHIGYYCQPKSFGTRIGSREFGLELDNWVGSFQDIHMICPLSGTKITPSCMYRKDELLYLSA